MSRRALIVDDDADTRAVAAALLRDAMPDVRIGEVGDALTLVSALDQPDLVVALVARQLAWADGLSLIKLLHQRHPRCATVLLGATPENQSDPEAQPDAHLSRGVAGLSRLEQAVRRAVDRRNRAASAGAGAGAGALNAIPVALIELSADEQVLSANTHATALLDQEDPRALVGRSLSELVSTGDERTPDSRRGAIASLAASTAHGISVLARPRAGAAFACRLMARANTRDGVLTGFTAVLIPGAAATEGRTDHLLYAVSHDLQQPLATTRSSARMLADKLQAQGRLDGEEGRMLRRILSGTERMDTLMRGLLDYVRTGQDPVVRESVDLGAVCSEVVRAMQAQVEATGGVVRWENLPHIQVSRAEITRLLENLIGNGIKFHGPDKPVVDIACAEHGDSWVLSVRDNGIGVDPSDAERIFEPFQRLHTESEYPGTGIGLANCRQICERHGGRIWVTSNPEGGSTFFAAISKDA